jgi:hypothetical protein
MINYFKNLFYNLNYKVSAGHHGKGEGYEIGYHFLEIDDGCVVYLLAEMRKVVIFRIPDPFDDDHGHPDFDRHHIDEKKPRLQQEYGVHPDARYDLLVDHYHGRNGDADEHIADGRHHEQSKIIHFLGGYIPDQAVDVKDYGSLESNSQPDKNNKLHIGISIKNRSQCVKKF